MTWQRGSQVRQWQADLFDAYPSDSDRLLRVPISGDVDDMSRLADALDLRNRGRAPSVSSKPGFKRSSQHRLVFIDKAARQAPPPAFSSPVSFSVGH